MSDTVKRLLLVVIFLSLTGCESLHVQNTIDQGGVKLISSEIEQLVADQVLELTEYDSAAMVKFFKNGGLYARNTLGVASLGRWHINAKDQLCIKFKKWGHGDLNCFSVYRFGAEYRLFDRADLLNATMTVPADAKSQLAEAETAPPADEENKANTLAAAPLGAAIVPPLTASVDQLPVPPQPLDNAPSVAGGDDLVSRAQDCPGCELRGAKLANSSLAKAKLAGADLSGADLAGANLKMANLKGAVLTNANLTNANLAGADLAGADLSGADLTGAELYGTILKGANLTNSRGGDFMGAIR